MWTNVPPTLKENNVKKDTAFTEMKYNILGHNMIGKKSQLCEQNCTELGKKNKDDGPLKRNSKIFCFSNVSCRFWLMNLFLLSLPCWSTAFW